MCSRNFPNRGSGFKVIENAQHKKQITHSFVSLVENFCVMLLEMSTGN